MTVDNILSLFQKLMDVLVIWLVLYYMLNSLRKNVKMVLLFKGVLFIVVLKIFSDIFNLATVGYLIDYMIMWGPLALIIIFQPEIRAVLEQLGRSQLLGRHKLLTVDEREKVVYEIVKSVEYMKKRRIGALITIERDNSLNDYIEKSTKLYADISSSLLISIFFPNNPLHDGAVIIQGDKVTSAGAVYPTSDNVKISKRLGTRHRAALGISEQTDSLSIVLSEETGRVSVTEAGNLNYNLSIDDLKILLLDELKPNKNTVLEEEEIKNEDE
jgi:diadenylate cyclase